MALNIESLGNYLWDVGSLFLGRSVKTTCASDVIHSPVLRFFLHYFHSGVLFFFSLRLPDRSQTRKVSEWHLGCIIRHDAQH